MIDSFSDIVPVKFHPYTSLVLKRIMHISAEPNEYNNKNYISEYLFNSSRDFLIKLFNDHGIKCQVDNKIVFEVELHGVRLFYGFYDWTFSIGLSYRDYSERR